MPRPNLQRIPAFYHAYINKVEEDDLHQAFHNQLGAMQEFLMAIQAEKQEFSYAPGKWSIKEVLQHLIDSERIFSYRALCIARNEATPLPGFSEDAYAAASSANARHWSSLVDEWLVVRRSAELLFDSFTETQLDATGIANDKSVYVLGIGFIIIGHTSHHMQVIRDRYLNTAN